MQIQKNDYLKKTKWLGTIEKDCDKHFYSLYIPKYMYIICTWKWKSIML